MSFLIYATIQWVLPSLINGLGFINNIIRPSKKDVESSTENVSLAPPVLNIPYEATNSAQINIRGYGTPNSKVAIYIDEEQRGTVEVSSDGTFEIKNIELLLGTNNIFGKSIDEKDRESLPSKRIKIVYDNEKPILEISEPEDGKNIQGGDKKIKIAGNSEPNAYVYINSSQVVLERDGKFESIQSLNDGENTFNIRTQDLAGNFTEVVRRVVFTP